MSSGVNSDNARAADRAAMAATLCCTFMIAQQVAGKATRDALFLSNFPVSSLPVMLIAAAMTSILVVLIASRVMARYGPAAVMPGAYSSSSPCGRSPSGAGVSPPCSSTCILPPSVHS